MIGIPSLGSQSKNFYELTLTHLYQNKHGLSSDCPLFFLDVDFDKINAHLPDHFEALLPLLLNMINALVAKNVDTILIPNITLHASIEKLDLRPENKKRIINPIFSGIEALQTDGIREITLIGTRHTMGSKLIAQFFENEDIKVNSPDAEDITLIDKLRLTVFESGYSEILESDMHAIIKRYEHVVVACTELSILNSDNKNIHNKCYDLARIQMAKAISTY